MQLSKMIISGSISTLLDASMCILWIITYTLVLIGTVKYRYPLISPITQAIVAPFEISVVFLFIKIGAFNYAIVAYLYWAFIEIAIFVVQPKSGFICRKFVLSYLGLVGSITGVMIWLVTVKEQMFFFSYFNTFVGMLLWLRFILRKDYPVNSIVLAIFVIKFIADVLAFLVYYGDGNWAINIMSVGLPILDAMFIFVFFKKRQIGVV